MADEPTVYPPSKDTHECPTCGTDNPPDETTCSLCGSPLVAEALNDQYEADEAEEPTLISPPPSSPLDFLPNEEDFLTASQAPTAGASSSLEDAPPELDSPLASLPPTVSAPVEEAKPLSQAVPRQPPAAELPPTFNTPLEETHPSPQIVPPQPWVLPRWMGLVGGALGLLLLLFLVNTMLFQGPDENESDVEEDVTAIQQDEVDGTNARSSPAPSQLSGSEIDSGMTRDPERAAPPDTANTITPLSSPNISQFGGQVQKAEELLPIQLYGIQASDDATLKTMIQSHMEEVSPQLQTAYNDSLSTDPQLSGAIVLELSLAPDGQVSQAQVHPTGIKNVKFLQAVQNLATQWSFSPIVSQTADVTVFYPVLLTPATVESATLLSHLKRFGRDAIKSSPPPLFPSMRSQAKRPKR